MFEGVRFLPSVVSVTVPFFALVVTGYAAGRWRVLDAAGINGLNRFVFFFALPALLFIKLSGTPPEHLFNARFLAAYGVGQLLMLGAAAGAVRLISRGSLAEASLFGLASCYGNIGFMGIPLLVAALGDAVAVPLAMILAIDLIVAVPLAMLLIEVGRGEGSAWRRVGLASVRVLLSNPLLIAIAAGILSALAGLEVPAPVARFAGLLGAAAGPSAMFAIGATLAGRPISGNLGAAAAMSAIKLLAYPLWVWAVMRAFAIAAPWSTAAVLGAAMPIAAVLFVIAHRYGVHPERAAAAVLLSTALSMVTVIVFLSLVGAVPAVPAE